MKRFLVFTGHDYYPCGVWEDFAGEFDNLAAAFSAIASAGYPNDYRWSHVVDTQSMRIVDEHGAPVMTGYDNDRIDGTPAEQKV